MHFLSSSKIYDHHLHQEPRWIVATVVMPNAYLLQRTEWLRKAKGEVIDTSSGKEDLFCVWISQSDILRVSLASINGQTHIRGGSIGAPHTGLYRDAVLAFSFILVDQNVRHNLTSQKD